MHNSQRGSCSIILFIGIGGNGVAAGHAGKPTGRATSAVCVRIASWIITIASVGYRSRCPSIGHGFLQRRIDRSQ